MIPLPQMWKYKKALIQWAPSGIGPYIFLFDRTLLSDANCVDKIFYLFLSQKYYRFCKFFAFYDEKFVKTNIFLR